ncbi:uncharacterized protein C8A04DRAFT_15859 [Dichotomopilus funicola]|uniref:Uncharacterized protein n=1 Tax=Dichotomopilus funicola TaxID=1934379 RepID=A0AAN6UV11_9PEZI|nr:hypothetical protein C8A04DRAFT_15859 [Dichotomopilus funicola]
MWPATTNSKISQTVGPSSPPETPRTASPVFGRKSSPRPRERRPPPPPPSQGAQHRRPMAPPPLLVPIGQAAVNGLMNMAFSNHAGAIRPGQLSPRSSSSSSVPASDSEDSDDSDDFAALSPPSPPTATEGLRPPTPDPPAPRPPVRVTRIVTETELVVEEMSDFGESDSDRANVIRPCAIEYPESDHSRSGSRTRPEIDSRNLFNGLSLNCSDDSDLTDMDEQEFHACLMKRRAERRHKRMTSGSIGKRTISESIGSDTDREDIRSLLGVEEAGSSARRLRRRVGDRRSLQFSDPPAPRIDELDEPASSDDEIIIGESLARELPYYEYVSMEVDSP